MNEDRRHGPSPSPRYEFGLQMAKVSQRIIDMVATGGRNGSHETGVPSRGPARKLKQHLCSRCGWVVLVAKSPRVGTCGPRKACPAWKLDLRINQHNRHSQEQAERVGGWLGHAIGI